VKRFLQREKDMHSMILLEKFSIDKADDTFDDASYIGKKQPSIKPSYGKIKLDIVQGCKSKDCAKLNALTASSNIISE
jgi:hypothetical protein